MMPLIFAVFRRLPGDQLEYFGAKSDRTEAGSLAYALNDLYKGDQEFTMYELRACAAIKPDDVLPEYRPAIPAYAEDRYSKCRCGHDRGVHAGHDGLGRCALRSCPTICGGFERVK